MHFNYNGQVVSKLLRLEMLKNAGHFSVGIEEGRLADWYLLLEKVGICTWRNLLENSELQRKSKAK